MNDADRKPPTTDSPQHADGLHGPAPVQAFIVMGVSGCGKSTVGELLAERLGWRFIDADRYHPQANVEKMRAGIALTDEDRWPWLQRLNAVLRHSVSKDEPPVLACSALRQRYRDVLRERIDGVVLVHLQGDFELLLARASRRQHDYMPASLLRSQFDTLEPPADAWTFDVRWTPEAIVDGVIARMPMRR